MGRAIDLFVTYRFLKILTTPFNKQDAYKLGIIDANGKVLKKRKDLKRSEEKKAYTIIHTLSASMSYASEETVCSMIALITSLPSKGNTRAFRKKTLFFRVSGTALSCFLMMRGRPVRRSVPVVVVVEAPSAEPALLLGVHAVEGVVVVLVVVVVVVVVAVHGVVDCVLLGCGSGGRGGAPSRSPTRASARPPTRSRPRSARGRGSARARRARASTWQPAWPWRCPPRRCRRG